MKKITLLACMLACYAAPSFAAVRTVNNFVNGAAQYSDLQTAINDSNNGDTVYVQGSPTAYSAVTIADKKLVLIGPGFAPNKQLPQVATIATINLNNTAAAGNVDGSEIQGFTFSNGSGILMQQIGGASYNNIKILRNVFNSCNINMQVNGSFSNFLVQNNYFSEGTILASSASNAVYNNWLVQNNVFYASNSTNANSIVNFNTGNTSNFLLDHNLFTGNSQGAAMGVSGILITNNIFVNKVMHSISTCTFNDNLTFNTIPTSTPWNISGNIEGSVGSNIDNQNPQMVNQTAVNNNTNSALLDYKINAGPAFNAGSDGKSIGLLFNTSGSLNWDNARTSRLPFIFSMNVTNPTIAPGNTLNVAVEARRSN
jgi:hypothetical protein